MMNLPFLLAPSAKDYIWGGSRLNDDFGKNIHISPLAETWECSTHPDGESVVASGENKGKTLGVVLNENPSFLGTHSLNITNGKFELPILIKLIDAKADLSVQVHPNDEYAMKNEGQLGKTEMWYILGAKSSSKIVYGFNKDVTAQEIREAIDSNSIERILNHIPINKDELYFIEAGTVHAIGAGSLIAEIQENSNVTYRLYDYNRIDKNGKKRTLHVEKALEVADLKNKSIPRQPMRVLRYKNGCASELLTRCKYFQVERLLLNTEIYRNLVDYKTLSNSFHSLLCIDGCGSISADDFKVNFFKGDCIFVPANSVILKLHGRAQFLDISC